MKSLLSESAKDVVSTLWQGPSAAEISQWWRRSFEARDMDHLLRLVDQVRDRVGPGCRHLGRRRTGEGDPGSEYRGRVDGIDAGAIVKSAAREFGGGGGGSPRLGRGGWEPRQTGEAVAYARKAVTNGLGGWRSAGWELISGGVVPGWRSRTPWA